MGHSTSLPAEDAQLQRESHFSNPEIKKLRAEFDKINTDNDSDSCVITKEQFRNVLHNHLDTPPEDHAFLDRLFDAFDQNNDGYIDFREFIHGLSMFVRGTPEEKLELSFRLYDINKDGLVSRKELLMVMLQMCSSFYPEAERATVADMVARFFDDMDVDGDGALSLPEYKLQALKEPMIVNFLDCVLPTPVTEGPPDELLLQ
ncbi:hypothetical protein RI367_000724 [Sorochytrium milnesiophthora]